MRTGRPRGLLCARDATKKPKTNLKNRSRFTPTELRLPPLCTGALAWRKKTTSRPWLGLFYEKLSQRYRNYYYADLGRQRLNALPAVAELIREHYALLDRVPPLDSREKVNASDPPADDLHVQKAELLGNGGLVDFAVRELQARYPMQRELRGHRQRRAQLYQDNGHYDRAIEVMKRSAPNYFALDIPDLPRSYWEALFPKPFWADLKRFFRRQRT